MHARKGLALPRVSHSDEIALVGFRHLRSTHVAEPVIVAQAGVTVAKNITAHAASGIVCIFVNYRVDIALATKWQQDGAIIRWG